MNMPLWFSNLLFWSIQVGLLVLAGALLPRLFRIGEPRVLLAYWRLLLAVSFALPFLQPWRRPPSVEAILVVPERTDVPLPPLSTSPVPRWHLPNAELIAQLLGVVILLGVVVRFVFLVVGLSKLRRLRQSSSGLASSSEAAAALHEMRSLLKASAEFRLSAHVDSPVTFGFASPVILLPERFASLDPRFQSAIACHELLHVRRRDWAHHLGEECLRAIFWFHPAIVWLISRVRLAREQVVDREVLRLTRARKPYLEALLEFAGGRPRAAAIPAPPFLAERQLVERVALMLKEVAMSRRKLIASFTVIACCLAGAVAVAAWTFPLKAAPPPSQSNSAIAAPLLHKIEVKHFDFSAGALNDSVVDAERARMEQLRDRPAVEAAYDQAKADQMANLLANFWSERGFTVEVHSTLTAWPRSSRYADLEFDVYQQTVLPGTLTGGVGGGVAGGVPLGVSGGVSGGVTGKMRVQPSSDIPSVDYSTIWIDTVKRGPMVRRVRGLGKLVREDSGNFTAKVALPELMAKDVHSNQHVTVDAHNEHVGTGHVIGVSPEVINGEVRVDVALDGALLAGISAGDEVDATIDIEKLDNVLQVGRPVHGAANTVVPLFKISADGKEATRVNVKLGRSSVNTIEILDGLKEGDKIILSDMSSVDSAERIRLTDDQHAVKH